MERPRAGLLKLSLFALVVVRFGVEAVTAVLPSAAPAGGVGSAAANDAVTGFAGIAADDGVANDSTSCADAAECATAGSSGLSGDAPPTMAPIPENAPNCGGGGC